MLVIVGASSAGLAAELALTEHWHDRWQYIPFGLCAIGLLASLIALRWTTPAAQAVVRVLSVLMVVGAGVGMYQHVAANYRFESEIRPSLAITELVLPALMGASPVLAPGALALFGALLWLTAPAASAD